MRWCTGKAMQLWETSSSTNVMSGTQTGNSLAGEEIYCYAKLFLYFLFFFFFLFSVIMQQSSFTADATSTATFTFTAGHFFFFLWMDEGPLLLILFMLL